ncbi:DUF1501 domain-containing protein [Azospirillum canadense]|uniref:DUF1501 domain-containing protein n=1 Tax=Azospirillum canadense TaxID=403962 RepID=UPI002226F8FE|nr:DUF1501 domain-containing protein [Azospirillum canadense]MCW2240011.1 uncharacterized protein (DUF1501 family) [Azospirillum canadense]
MTVTRRGLIQGTLAAGLATMPGVRSLAFAADGSPDVLVVVFLRGGADALSLVAPADDPDYLAARAPELRVATEGPKAGLRLAQEMAPAIDFRLHPEAAPLAELYAGRQLAIVHAVGLSDGTRSHFVAQDLMEHGIGQEGELARTGTGWVARWLDGDGARPPGPVAAVGTVAAPPATLARFGAAVAVPDLRAGLAPPGGPQAADVLAALHHGESPYERAARAALGGLSAIDGHLSRGPDGKVESYGAEGGAVYEETEAGRALQTVARILKMDVGLRVACVDVGGWDTHEHQPGRFANAVGQLSRALAAFHADTVRYHGRVTLAVMSEFGRRLRTNRSQGTDHGHGGAMLVLGGRVAGGRMFGRWPGLASHQLDRGVDLAVTTDYRAVLAELVGPAAAARAFPGFRTPPPLGLQTG